MQEFIYKYDGKETGIDFLININGYYIANNYSIDNWIHDTIYGYRYMIFFKDGMFAQDFHSYALNFNDVANFFQDIHDRNTSEFYACESCNWGRYLIFGDTIKIQYIVRPILYSSNASWNAREVWYKMIDTNTILKIFEKPICIKNIEKMHYYEARKLNPVIPLPCTFVPTDRIPSSNCWLKQEKWFWCNEEDWKNYMDSLKKEKMKKK